MCQEKFVQIYTKTFGGKIWSNLHRVSPGNFFSKKIKDVCSQISRQKYRNISSCKNNWGKLLIFLCNMKMMGWTFDFPRNKFWLRITLPYLFHFFARGNVSNTTYKEAAWRDKPFPIKIWRPNLRYPFLLLFSNLPPLTCLS